MSRVWHDQTITDQMELLALLAIADYANEQGVAWPSIDSIASKCRCSKRALFRILNRLKKSGKLEIDSGGGRKTSHYTIQNATPDLKSPLTQSQGSHASMCHRTPDLNDTAAVTQLCHPIHHRTTIEPSRKGKGASLPLSEVLEAWNQKAENTVIPKAEVLSAKRKAALGARLAEPFFRANWKPALERLHCSKFCLGQNNRGWKANFGWFISPDAVVKIMEGQYDSSLKSNGKPALIDKVLDDLFK